MVQETTVTSDTVCPLCDWWTKSTFAKRPTTQVQPAEVEKALVVGFWLSTRGHRALCEKHASTVVALENAQILIENPPPPPEALLSQAAAEARQNYLDKLKALGKVLCPFCDALLDDLNQEHGCPAKIPTLVQVPSQNAGMPLQVIPRAVPPPPPPPPTVATYPCPFCRKPTYSGAVHSCDYNEPEPTATAAPAVPIPASLPGLGAGSIAQAIINDQGPKSG